MLPVDIEPTNVLAPFPVKRVYYIFDTAADIRRGRKAHINVSQLAMAVSGACTIMLDDGLKRVEHRLGVPTKGLIIDNMVWHEMYDFTPDCVLVVLASEHYEDHDCIANYDEFVAMARHQTAVAT